MRLFHRHRWESLAAGRYAQEFTSYKSMTSVPMGAVTLVLQRCARCQKVRTIELDGVWTLEQING